MTGYDVHADKAIKELRARLDQAERERDEARAMHAAAEADLARVDALVAGEAERVREAVAAEREACAVLCKSWTTTTVGDQYAHGCAARIRTRATSPAPVVSAERAVVEAAEAHVRAALALRAARFASDERGATIGDAQDCADFTFTTLCDALAAARKGGG